MLDEMRKRDDLMSGERREWKVEKEDLLEESAHLTGQVGAISIKTAVDSGQVVETRSIHDYLISWFQSSRLSNSGHEGKE